MRIHCQSVTQILCVVCAKVIFDVKYHSILLIKYYIKIDLTLYDFYLSYQLKRLFGFLPRRENLIILFSPFDQPLAWFSYSFMC